jgi:hypothetical protein
MLQFNRIILFFIVENWGKNYNWDNLNDRERWFINHGKIQSENNINYMIKK